MGNSKRSDDPWASDSDTDSDTHSFTGPTAPLVRRYGDVPLVHAARSSDDIRRLISTGATVTPEALFAAIQATNVDGVRALLDAGADPNLRSNRATIIHSNVDNLHADSSYANRDFTPTFWPNFQEWYPIQFAAFTRLSALYEADKRAAVMTLLLDRGADIYALLRQPIQPPFQYPYPGEEDPDLSSLGADPPEPLFLRSIQDIEPPNAASHCLRTVLHSILEEGGSMFPILTHPTTTLSLSYRDPQGRTLLHSACRSAIGADTCLTGTAEDCGWDPNTGTLYQSPFLTDPSDPANPSLFHFLRVRGAESDLYAVDAKAKNILHALFEAQDINEFTDRPPVIKDALGYVLRNCKALLNRSDKYGSYPLHSALQRRRRHWIHNAYRDLADVETEVERLLDAGADPRVTDSRRNTALHYLADEGLEGTIHGDGVRDLARRFLREGVDVNARNATGRSALEIVLDDNGDRDGLRGYEYAVRRKEAKGVSDVDAEVLELFGQYGVSWREGDGRGRGLLHFVARNKTKRAEDRARMLVERGVEVGAVDENRETALDVARRVDNEGVVKVLEGRM
ncbi:MAG: hypothetical protein M1820_006585 [Bogoriella megaspora]|nr:MAG: hypothetical protein M1820_006585 [Bogoriella megaspora]